MRVRVGFIVAMVAMLLPLSTSMADYTGTWSATGGMTTSRYHHTATLLPNGKVLVAGGQNGSSYLSSAELYDPSNGTWSATGGMTTSGFYNTATLLPNGKVLVTVGTSSAELYDPSNGTWSATGRMTTGWGNSTATLLPNGKVLVAGGTSSKTELYDPNNGTWNATGSMTSGRYGHTATLLLNGKVLAAGGRYALVTAELYTPPTPDLSITIAARPDPVGVGRDLTYSLSATHTGGSESTNVAVVLTLPSDVSVVSASASQGSCSTSPTVTCSLGTLLERQTVTMTIVVNPTTSGNVSATAQISSDLEELGTANNTAAITATVVAPDLGITISDAPDPVGVAANLSSTLTATNVGMFDATNVTVTTILPDRVTVVSASPSQGTCTTSPSLNCSLGTLGTGARATVALVVRPSLTGTLTTTASVSADPADETPSNNTATATTSVEKLSRLSIATNRTQGNAGTYAPSISEDGRYVAYASDASNLVLGDTNGARDVFVHDRANRTTTRVSIGPDGTQGNEISTDPVISGNGRFVVFQSIASNLVPDDTNGLQDVFAYDRLAKTLTRISVTSSGEQALGVSSFSTVSADGRFVAFVSTASNLVAGDTNGKPDIFVRSLRYNTMQLVSVSSKRLQGNGVSTRPSISRDGRYVAFQSTASNLVVDDTNLVTDVFVRDRTGITTSRVSVTNAEAEANGPSVNAAISGDGTAVAFETAATNLVGTDTNGKLDIYVRHPMSGTTKRVSVTSTGGQPNGNSIQPSISTTGDVIAFQSVGTNLVPNDLNRVADIFLRTVAAKQTERVSVAESGVQSNGESGVRATISGDGRFVVFASKGSNLVPGDTNAVSDIFMRVTR